MAEENDAVYQCFLRVAFSKVKQDHEQQVSSLPTQQIVGVLSQRWKKMTAQQRIDFGERAHKLGLVAGPNLIETWRQPKREEASASMAAAAPQLLLPPLPPPLPAALEFIGTGSGGSASSAGAGASGIDAAHVGVPAAASVVAVHDAPLTAYQIFFRDCVAALFSTATADDSGGGGGGGGTDDQSAGAGAGGCKRNRGPMMPKEEKDLVLQGAGTPLAADRVLGYVKHTWAHLPAGRRAAYATLSEQGGPLARGTVLAFPDGAGGISRDPPPDRLQVARAAEAKQAGGCPRQRKKARKKQPAAPVAVAAVPLPQLPAPAT